MMRSDSKLITKIFLRMIPVQILLVVISGVNTVIDGAFASNFIGPDAMAVTELFMPFNKILDAINALMFGGSQLLCGKYLGEKMSGRTKSIFTLDMSAIAVISIVSTIFCEIFPGLISGMLGSGDEFRTDLSNYIRGAAIGILPFLLASQLTAFLQLERQEKRGYVAIVSMFVSNAFFNYLFIGVLHMGLFGLGLATSVGNWIFFMVLVSYYFTGKATITFSVSSIVRSDLLDILKLGLPNALNQVCLFIRARLINEIIATNVGKVGLSAYGAIGAFGCIYWAVPAGVTSAVILLASVYTGEQDKTGVTILMKTFMKKGVGLVVAMSIVFMALSVPLTNIFFHDPSSEVYKLTVQGFLLFPLSCPFSAITIGLNYFYHCLRYEKIVNTVTLLDGLVNFVVIAFFLVPHMGLLGIWIAQIGNGVVSVLVLYGFSVYYNKGVPKKFDQILCLPKDFGVPDENRMDISISSMEDVICVSESVSEFCKGHSINEKHANYTALCVEEMAGNIVQHGFDDGKKHSIDMRVSILKDEIRISIKDDCKLFNPEEAEKMFNPDDITHNIGIRMVGKISKSMSYQNTLGLNVLSIVL